MVVPDTQDHSNVPILVGTNVLKLVKDDVDGACGLTLSGSGRTWNLALQCLSHGLAKVKTTKAITVPPQSKTVVSGFTRLPVSVMRHTVMTEEIPQIVRYPVVCLLLQVV